MGMMFSDVDAEFNARKAGQVAAFFVLHQGGLLNVVKLIKLIYLAERSFMGLYEEPMLMDNFVSMRHGPVNSAAYDCVNTGRSGWDEFISDREDHNIALATATLVEEDLDELSEADIEVLTNIWAEFGTMNQWQLVRYTHDHCPEWEDPGNSSAAIPYSRIFKFLAKQDPDKLSQNISEIKQLEKMLSRVK